MAEQNIGDSVQINNPNLAIKELEGLRDSGLALSSHQQEKLADSYAKRAQPPGKLDAVPDLDAAAREYVDLWSRIDETWAPDRKFTVPYLDEPMALTKEHYSDVLQYKLAQTYLMRAAAWIHASQQPEKARRDLDMAIPILERLESEKSLGAQTTAWEADFILRARGLLRMGYGFRGNGPDNPAERLRDLDDFMRLWYLSNGTDLASAPPDELQMLAGECFRRMNVRRALGHSRGVIEDLHTGIKALEQARKGLPNDPVIEEELRKAKSLLPIADFSGFVGGIIKRFKK